MSASIRIHQMEASKTNLNEPKKKFANLQIHHHQPVELVSQRQNACEKTAGRKTRIPFRPSAAAPTKSPHALFPNIERTKKIVAEFLVYKPTLPPPPPSSPLTLSSFVCAFFASTRCRILRTYLLPPSVSMVSTAALSHSSSHTLPNKTT